jgi:hypothetical protein
VQKPDQAIVRVPTVQEQDQNRADPYALRRQAAVPRADVNEHCFAHVHEPVGCFHSLIEGRGSDAMPLVLQMKRCGEAKKERLFIGDKIAY